MQQIRLPLVEDGEYDFIVDWGDGNFSNIVTGDVDPGNLSGVTHSYEEQGVKRLTITGTINGWNFQQGVTAVMSASSCRRSSLGVRWTEDTHGSR